MIVDWYVKSNPWGRPITEKVLSKIVETATPLMNYFCKRLTDAIDDELEISKIETLFAEIVQEMPVMNYRISKEDGVDQFIIMYNSRTEIRLTDSTKQIYREIKLTKILS